MGLLGRLTEHRRLQITRHDLVVEVGSGHMPWYRADVLVDKYVYDDSERAASCIIDRPFVAADAASLPFADGSFDFLYCSHVVEHLTRPTLALREFARVAKRGVIYCPSSLWERMFGSRQHRWIVSVRHGALVFRGKQGSLSEPELSRFWHRADVQREWWHMYRRFRQDLEITYRFRGDIPCKQIGTSLIDTGSVVASTSRALERTPSLMPRLRMTGKQGALRCAHCLLRCRRPWSLLGMLRCPACKTRLGLADDGELRCSGCGLHFARLGKDAYWMLIDSPPQAAPRRP